jgi:SAM-dependent methyltransferase
MIKKLLLITWLVSACYATEANNDPQPEDCIPCLPVMPPPEAACYCLNKWGRDTSIINEQMSATKLLSILVKEAQIPWGYISVAPYGKSFAWRNNPMIDVFVQERTDWNALCIADIGAGMGLSTLYLINLIICKLTSNPPKNPVEIHASDLNHGDVLSRLAIVVNAAYPNILQMEGGTLDITKTHLKKDSITHIFAFNLFHFIEGASWPKALKNIARSLRAGGTITLTVNDVKENDGFTSKARGYHDWNFYISHIVIFNPTLDKFVPYGTQVDRWKLKSNPQPIPGGKIETISQDIQENEEFFNGVFDSYIKFLEAYKYADLKRTDILAAIRNGTIAIHNESYVFTTRSLQSCLESSRTEEVPLSIQWVDCFGENECRLTSKDNSKISGIVAKLQKTSEK